MLIFLCNWLFLLILLILCILCCGYLLSDYYRFKYQTFLLNKILLSLEALTFLLITCIIFSFLFCNLEHNLWSTVAIETTTNYQPLFYRFCALWTTYDGSLLLWIWFTHICIFFISIQLINQASIRLNLFRGILYSIYTIFCYLIYLLTDLTIAVNLNWNITGNGLSPLLYDPILLIHPPLVFFGNAITILFYAYFIYALITNSIIFNIQLIKNWLLLAISCLTCGLFLGSWWAYHELGWGGWWFWDPIETLSLLPWLGSLLVLHALYATRINLQFNNLFLKSLASLFLISVLSIIIVRAGFLISVHSFITDLLHTFFFPLTWIILGCLLLLILFKKPLISMQTWKNIWLNRIYVYLNYLFIYLSFFLFFGLFSPLIAKLFTTIDFIINPAFYIYTICIPAGLSLLILQRLKLELVQKLLFVSILGIIFFLYTKLTNQFSGIFTSVLIVSTLVLFGTFLYTTLVAENQKKNNILFLLLHSIPFLFVLAVLRSKSLTITTFILPTTNYTIDIYQLLLTNVKTFISTNYNSLTLYFNILTNFWTLKSSTELQYYKFQQTYISKTSVYSNPDIDLHLVPGDGSSITGWYIKFILVFGQNLIWGCFLILPIVIFVLYTVEQKTLSKLYLF